MTSISKQMRKRIAKPPKIKKEKKLHGNIEKMTSTGSTLLDLAITGGRVHGGGIPSGIMVEIFGPSQSGKTVLLCEIAGNILRNKGQAMFKDPEARLDKQFAAMFGMDFKLIEYDIVDTIPEVFAPVRDWQPKSTGGVHGIFADSLAALSTDLEMSKEVGDKMGMRRPKEFSEQCRRTCRTLKKKDYLMVCSNQIRDNIDAGLFEEKVTSTGGHAIGFYSSLRLRMMGIRKIPKKLKIKGKEVTRIIGVTTTVQVYKSTVWKPFRTAPLTILFDYGVDDIRQNLQFVKDFTSASIYTVGKHKLDKSIEGAIVLVESKKLEFQLKEQVIDVWEGIEEKFKVVRKKKVR